MENDWWRKMYVRNIERDPSNVNYSFFNQPGLTCPLTCDSNPQYAVAMNRHQDGVNAYKMGAVSPQAAKVMGNPNPVSPMLVGVSAAGKVGVSVRPKVGISGCAARTGDPSGCAAMYLSRPSVGATAMSYTRLG